MFDKKFFKFKKLLMKIFFLFLIFYFLSIQIEKLGLLGEEPQPQYPQYYMPPPPPQQQPPPQAAAGGGTSSLVGDDKNPAHAGA